MFFFDFNQRLTELYPELYQSGGGSQSQAIANFGKKWGWYSSIYQLAQGDIFRFDDVAKLPLHKALLMLSFEAEKINTKRFTKEKK